MANSIASITRYFTKAIDEVFVKDSRTEILENGSKFIDLNFKEAGYVKIYSILMDGLSWYYRANSLGEAAGSTENPAGRNSVDYARYAPEYGVSGARDGFARGSVEGGWEIFKLRYYRAKQFVVDQMDDEETAGLIIGNLLTQFVRTKVVPEVDALRFQTLIEATNGGIGNLIHESLSYESLIQGNGLSSQSILAKFNRAFVWLNKHEVPDDDQVIFVSEDVWGLLLGDPLLTRFFDVSKQKSESGIDWEVQTYMGRPIIHVPDSRFFTHVELGNNGYLPAADSKKINYIICDRRAIVPVVKLDYTKIWTPDTQDDFIGYKVNFALYHDSFIPKNKKVGVFASIGNDGADTNILAVNLARVSGDLTATLAGYATQPAGLLGSVYYKDATSDPFTIGADTNVSTATKVANGGSVTLPTVNEHALYFAVADNDGIVLAKSAAVAKSYVKSATFTVTLPEEPVAVSSDDTSVATVGYSTTTLTVTKVAAGHCYVTVSYANGTFEVIRVVLSN